MVVISIKYPDGDGFIFETTAGTRNDDLITALVAIHNGRLRARVIIDCVRNLASYGPLKKPEEIGLDCIKEHYAGDKIEKDALYNEDPTGKRTGNRPDDHLADVLRRTAQDLEDYIDKSQISKGMFMTGKCLDEKIINVKGAVAIAYPMGLPDWDTLQMILESEDGLSGTNVANQILNPSNTSLWTAGKEFERGKLVSDRLGVNEKTKVIAKLQTVGSGPPSREPIVTEEEQRAMMAHYFKRQEELKKLSEADDDDDYLNSEWADPKQMKRNLQGIGGNIKAPGLRF